MSTLGQTIKQAAKNTAAATLTTGVIISVGLLSYCGMLVITPSIVLAYTAFVLAGLVDGEVFWQNINNGINHLTLLGPQGLHTLIINELDKEKEYKQYKKHVASFNGKQLTNAQHEEKKQATKKLHRMQKVLVAQKMQDTNQSLSSLKRKRWLIRLGMLVSIGSGIAFGFATAAALSTALVTITPMLALAMWPLALIACVGNTLLMYNTITNIVCHDSYKKWRKKINAWFERSEKNRQHPKIYRLRQVLLVLGISVGVLATIATAGTWWLAVKAGAELLPATNRFAGLIRNLLVPLAASTNLAFTIRNTLTSTKGIIHYIKHSNADPQTTSPEAAPQTLPPLEPTARTINWWQRLNPFRLISAIIKTPFRAIIFVGHLIAIGLTGDRAPGLSYSATIASALVGALSDAFVDWHYIFSLGNHHDHKHHHHGHHDEHDEHSHGMITNFALNVALSPVLVASAIWDYYATPNISFADALRTNFDIKKSEPLTSTTEPALSNTMQLDIDKHRLTKQKARLEQAWIGRTIAKEKIAVLNKIIANPSYAPSNTDYDTLEKRRSMFTLFGSAARSSTSLTKTERVVFDVMTIKP